MAGAWIGRFLAWLAVAALSGCAGPNASESVNVGDAKIAARDFHRSGAYERELTVVAAQATSWMREAAPGSRRPALVLDVDETALSNWEVIQANDFGRFATGPCALPEGPCGWAAWDQLGRSAPLPPTVELAQTAGELGVAVFFVTGRPESQRAGPRGRRPRRGGPQHRHGSADPA